MRNLFRFIVKYHATFLFVILQIFCFSLIVINNHYQRTVFDSAAEVFVGRIQHSWMGVTSYFGLARQNQLLMHENTRLRNELQERRAYSRSFRLGENRPDFVYRDAMVINRSIWSNNNFITIDKGIKHGLQPNMWAISSQGLVGIVYNCSENYATIIPVINTEFKLSVKINKNNYFGSLSWSGKDYRFARMSEIPLHIEIAIGDTIVTSGFSAIFPAEVPVGIIDSYQKINSTGYYEINVKLFTDFATIRHLYIIENRNRTEILDLESNND